MTKITLLKGDITKMCVDAIVNAANAQLLGGAGVNGAIQAAAGPALLQECLSLRGCETGRAKITKGYNLPAKYVIHAVGPVWQGGNANEDELLRSAYDNSLRLADERGLHTVAFPAISTGIYGFPKRLAAEIAIAAVNKYCHEHDVLDEVSFVCFDDENYHIYRQLLK